MWRPDCCRGCEGEARALHRGSLLEFFWTDRRLLFQWPKKKPISAGALSCSSAPRRVLSRTLSESLCWSLENTTMGRLWLFALGHQGKTASSSPTFLWSKRTRRSGKRPLNRHPRLCVQPIILIPVNTCYFFDAKYKETSDGSLIWEHKFKAVFTKRRALQRVCLCDFCPTRGGKHGPHQHGRHVV